MQQETYLFITTNAPHRKENGRNDVLKFFHRDWRRCTKSYPRMVKTISLGMWRQPHWTYTLSVCTCPTSVFRSKHLSHKLGASFCLFWFDFYFRETTTLSFIYERATGNMGWNMLDAIIRLGKGMLELILKDTYNCMIHELVNE